MKKIFKWFVAGIAILFVILFALGPGAHIYWSIQHKNVKNVATAVLEFQVVCGRFPSKEEGLEILLVEVPCGEKTWKSRKLDLSNGLGNKIEYKTDGRKFVVVSKGFFDSFELDSGPYLKNGGTELVKPFTNNK